MNVLVKTESAWVLQTFPSTYKEKNPETIKSVPQFTFPCPSQM